MRSKQRILLDEPDQNKSFYNRNHWPGSPSARLRQPVFGATTMKTNSIVAIASAVALSAFALAVTPGAARAGPIVPPGRYCLLYDEGGTDCSFTSYAQCLATASGLAAECYGKTVSDDEASSNRGWAGETRASVL
jgi:Protein of unknown function (DUF3551)